MPGQRTSKAEKVLRLLQGMTVAQIREAGTLVRIEDDSVANLVHDAFAPDAVKMAMEKPEDPNGHGS